MARHVLRRKVIVVVRVGESSNGQDRYHRGHRVGISIRVAYRFAATLDPPLVLPLQHIVNTTHHPKQNVVGREIGQSLVSTD